jgi:short-subunit dehydrogenase
VKKTNTFAAALRAMFIEKIMRREKAGICLKKISIATRVIIPKKQQYFFGSKKKAITFAAVLRGDVH